MIAVRSVDSFKYATRLFGYLFVVLLIGGGLLGLGGSIGYSDARALVGTGAYNTSELAGGIVLGVLGAFVLVTGWFAISYKLIADAVATGTEHVGTTGGQAEAAEPADSSQPAETTAPAADEQVSEREGEAPPDTDQEPAEPPTCEPPETPEPQPTDREPTSTDETEPATASSGAATDEVVTDTAESSETQSARPKTETGGRGESTTEGREQSAAERTARTGEVDAGSAWESEQTGSTRREESELPPDWESKTETPERSGQEPTIGAPPDSSDSTAETGSEDTSGPPTEESRPEPSPEEIAFGSEMDSGDDDSGVEEDDQQVDGGGVEPAGDPAAGDPLADPTDDE